MSAERLANDIRDVVAESCDHLARVSFGGRCTCAAVTDLLYVAKAEALREAAENTLAHNAWENLSVLHKFTAVATHGAALRYPPQEIARWLRERAAYIETGVRDLQAHAAWKMMDPADD